MKEIVNLIPYFISVLISVIFYNLYYLKINNYKLELNKRNVVTILITAFLVLINNSYNNVWIKIIILTIIFCIMFKIIYKDSTSKIIITYFIIYAGIILMEIVFTNIFNLFGLLNDYAAVIPFTFIKIFLSALVEFVIFVLVSIKPIKKFLNNIIYNLNNNIKIIHIIYLLFFASFPLGTLNILNFSTKDSIFWVLILSLLYFIFTLLIFSSKSKEYILKNANKRLVEYNNKYSHFLEEYKIYQHNIKNKLNAIKSYGNKKVNSLINDLLNEESTITIKNNNLYNVPRGIKGIVTEKLYNAKIEFIISNDIKNDPFEKLSPKIFNCTSECLGIALDNAIEACENLENPVVSMDLYEDMENIYIKVGNNFKNSIDIEELGKKYYSTKNRGSGLGLFSIKNNKIIKERISIINDFYFIELKIKKEGKTKSFAK